MSLNDILLQIKNYLTANDRPFSLMIEIISILIIAPLTSRYIAWRSNTNWSVMRERLIHSIYYTLLDINDILINWKEHNTLTIANYRTHIKRMENLIFNDENFERSFTTEIADNGTFRISFENDDKHLYILSPASFIIDTNFDQLKYVREMAIELQNHISNSANCLTPEMALAISEMLTPKDWKQTVYTSNTTHFGLLGNIIRGIDYNLDYHDTIQAFSENISKADISASNDVLLTTIYGDISYKARLLKENEPVFADTHKVFRRLIKGASLPLKMKRRWLKEAHIFGEMNGIQAVFTSAASAKVFIESIDILNAEHISLRQRIIEKSGIDNPGSVQIDSYH